MDLKKALEAAQRSAKEFKIKKVSLPSGMVLEEVEVTDEADARRFRIAMGIESIGVMSAPAKVSSGPTLSEQIKTHIEDMRQAGRHAKNVLDTQHSLRIFLEVVGDKHLNEVSPTDMREFFSALERWPSNAHKLAAFKGKTAKEILKAVKTYEGPLLEDRTKQKHRDRLATFFNACEREGLLSTAPPHRALPRRAKSVANKITRQPFKPSEVATIFGSEWPKWSSKSAHRKWVPLLGLFTGARINELAQLYADDFTKEGGQPGFWIQGKRKDQRLKNANSRRFIPLPSRLIDLGIMRYVDSCAAETRLFPGLKFSKTSGYADSISDQFGRYLDSVSLSSPALTFHSFRHTLASRMASELGIAPVVISSITGHANEGPGAMSNYLHSS